MQQRRSEQRSATAPRRDDLAAEWQVTLQKPAHSRLF